MSEYVLMILIIVGVILAIAIPNCIAYKEGKNLIAKENKCYTACFPYQMTNCYESNDNLYAVCANEKIIKIESEQ